MAEKDKRVRKQSIEQEDMMQSKKTDKEKKGFERRWSSINISETGNWRSQMKNTWKLKRSNLSLKLTITIIHLNAFYDLLHHKIVFSKNYHFEHNFINQELQKTLTNQTQKSCWNEFQTEMINYQTKCENDFWHFECWVCSMEQVSVIIQIFITFFMNRFLRWNW